MIKGHGGNIYDISKKLGCSPSEIVDMSSNINPLGPLPGLLNFLDESLPAITALPEVEAEKAVRSFAGRHGIDPECVMAGNGTTQFIFTLPKALGTRKALIIGPTYVDYADACTMHRVDHTYVMADKSRLFQPDIYQIDKKLHEADTVFICNPNNPTGTLIPSGELEWLCVTHPDIHFIVDESYLPFINKGEKESMIPRRLPNVLVLNSMSKIFRIPGLRIGFLISSEIIIKKMIQYMLPWSVNSLAQAAVCYLMTKRIEVDEFIEQTRTFIETEKKQFAEMLQNDPCITLFPSTTAFILARLPGNLTAERVCAHLAADRILIRNASNFKGLDEHFIRISLKSRKVNQWVAEKLLSITNKK
jgi:threonine-phosphate decarboxylase